MKTVGLIGGVAWPSTLIYYRLLNEKVQAALGVPHSARCVIVSLDFAEVLQDMSEGRPQDASARMQHAARQLKAAGAELVAILANTGHFAAEAVQDAAGLPLVHIAKETAHAVRGQLPKAKRLGVLGTSHALRADFFMQAFSEQEGFELVLPDAQQRTELDTLIFGELASGRVGPDAAAVVARICASLAAQGAEGIVLGCTELAELQPWLASPVTLFDSTELHARAIVREMLAA
ncbi:aspartate/glutamate racemase family protein [Ottowia thiooxydans]|uniref:aspartate/glutamate racemase family protein n=1 Tax=Ottowia thiooxydans TaxID=219182 RepID=UPI0003F75B19|nr:amino acid racemase [Ottowia thiooxydans]